MAHVRIPDPRCTSATHCRRPVLQARLLALGMLQARLTYIIVCSVQCCLPAAEQLLLQHSRLYLELGSVDVSSLSVSLLPDETLAAGVCVWRGGRERGRWRDVCLGVDGCSCLIESRLF